MSDGTKPLPGDVPAPRPETYLDQARRYREYLAVEHLECVRQTAAEPYFTPEAARHRIETLCAEREAVDAEVRRLEASARAWMERALELRGDAVAFARRDLAANVALYSLRVHSDKVDEAMERAERVVTEMHARLATYRDERESARDERDRMREKLDSATEMAAEYRQEWQASVERERGSWEGVKEERARADAAEAALAKRKQSEHDHICGDPEFDANLKAYLEQKQRADAAEARVRELEAHVREQARELRAFYRATKPPESDGPP